MCFFPSFFFSFNSHKNAHYYRNLLQFSSNKNQQGQSQILFELPPQFYDEITNDFGRSEKEGGSIKGNVFSRKENGRLCGM